MFFYLVDLFLLPPQTSPGVYDEEGLVALDYVIHVASQLGLRVILSLIDNWQYYNGVDQVSQGMCVPSAGKERDLIGSIQLSYLCYPSVLTTPRSTWTGAPQHPPGTSATPSPINAAVIPPLDASKVQRGSTRRRVTPCSGRMPAAGGCTAVMSMR